MKDSVFTREQQGKNLEKKEDKVNSEKDNNHGMKDLVKEKLQSSEW